MSPSTPNGSEKDRGSYTLGVIAGKLQAIHQDVTTIKQTMVTRDLCDDKHARVDGDIRRAFGVARGAAQAIGKLKDDSSPGIRVPGQSWDFWSWASRRLPVVVGPLILAGAVYWLRATIDGNAARSKSAEVELQEIKAMLAQPSPKIPVPFYVPSYVPLSPDAGVPRHSRRHR